MLKLKTIVMLLLLCCLFGNAAAQAQEQAGSAATAAELHCLIPLDQISDRMGPLDSIAPGTHGEAYINSQSPRIADCLASLELLEEKGIALPDGERELFGTIDNMHDQPAVALAELRQLAIRYPDEPRMYLDLLLCSSALGELEIADFLLQGVRLDDAQAQNLSAALLRRALYRGDTKQLAMLAVHGCRLDRASAIEFTKSVRAGKADGRQLVEAASLCGLRRTDGEWLDSLELLLPYITLDELDRLVPAGTDFSFDPQFQPFYSVLATGSADPRKLRLLQERGLQIGPYAAAFGDHLILYMASDVLEFVPEARRQQVLLDNLRLLESVDFDLQAELRNELAGDDARELRELLASILRTDLSEKDYYGDEVWKSSDLAKYFSGLGQDPQSFSRQQSELTELELAIKQEDADGLAQLLVSPGQREAWSREALLDAVLKCIREEKPQLLEVLLANGAPLQCAPDDKPFYRNPLNLAAQLPRPREMAILLKHGADVNFSLEYRDELGCWVGRPPISSLHSLQLDGEHAQSEIDDTFACAALLVEHGAQLNFYWDATLGEQALYIPQLYGWLFSQNSQLLNWLIEQGADPALLPIGRIEHPFIFLTLQNPLVNLYWGGNPDPRLLELFSGLASDAENFEALQTAARAADNDVFSMMLGNIEELPRDRESDSVFWQVCTTLNTTCIAQLLDAGYRPQDEMSHQQVHLQRALEGGLLFGGAYRQSRQPHAAEAAIMN